MARVKEMMYDDEIAARNPMRDRAEDQLAEWVDRLNKSYAEHLKRDWSGLYEFKGEQDGYF